MVPYIVSLILTDFNASFLTQGYVEFSLPTVQFLIACSLQKQRGHAWSILSHEWHFVYLSRWGGGSFREHILHTSSSFWIGTVCFLLHERSKLQRLVQKLQISIFYRIVPSSKQLELSMVGAAPPPSWVRPHAIKVFHPADEWSIQSKHLATYFRAQVGNR